MSGYDELTATFDAQRAAYRREGPPTAAVRRDRLDRLQVAVLGAADELVDAIAADFGHRPPAFSLMLDIMVAVDGIGHLRDHLEEWMAPAEVPGSAEAGIPTTVDVRPRGVVGIVGPWNIPVGLVVQPAAEAIAAGNRVMVKFSEVSARTGAALARAIAAEFTAEELIVINGGLDTAIAFSDLPFDHLLLTGSPAAGRAVARAAAANLVPVTLELGGKNPVVLGPDADLPLAAERVAVSRLANGGQACLSPDYVFVPRSHLDEFVSLTREAFISLYPDFAVHPAVTPIVDDKNVKRITALISDAVDKGATAVPTATPTARYLPPILLLDVTDDMTITREEVFGPVLTVYPYDDIAEVIDYVAAHPSPLAAYWYGEDTPDFRSFRHHAVVGSITRNDYAAAVLLPDVPFGGIGQSGMGAYNGRTGFDTFSHRRPVSTTTFPGGVAGALGPAALTDPAVADGMWKRIADARKDALRRLGR
ncbi:aldehyde dehydrogenase family protein [Catenuloplanes sp. NPDC051500]|uniref:aldehyde dehydrogenase family protein n=1 Tax=Catenuloplanes sp. NPDC051500 TaxID=3363959 RepID=UPI00379B4FA0